MPIINPTLYWNPAPTNATADVHHSRDLPGNGYFSLAINNALSVVLSAGLSTGLVQFTVGGTEE